MYMFIGIVLGVVLAFAAMYSFSEDNPVMGFICVFAVVAAVAGGIYTQQETFVNECEAAGGYMLGDSCFGFSDPDFDDD